MNCPECHCVVPEGAAACASCGYPIGMRRPSAATSGQPAAAVQCQRCSAPLPPLPVTVLSASVRCPHCGETVRIGTESSIGDIDSDRTREQPLQAPRLEVEHPAPAAVQLAPHAHSYSRVPSQQQVPNTSGVGDSPVAKSIAELIAVVTALLVIAALAGLLLWFPVRDCPHCGGDGRIWGLARCPPCHGDGKQSLIEMLTE